MRNAVDTNVLIRLFAKDHGEQWEVASEIMTESAVYIADSVWLECEWVLRSLFGFDRATIASLLNGLLGLSNVECESKQTLANIVALFEKGMDFADAFHVCTAVDCEEFITFDRKFVSRAAKFGIQPSVRLL